MTRKREEKSKKRRQELKCNRKSHLGMLVAVRSDDPGAVERSMEVWTGGGKQWRRAVAQRAVFRCRERGDEMEGNEQTGDCFG